jgi:hypothetical protein
MDVQTKITKDPDTMNVITRSKVRRPAQAPLVAEAAGQQHVVEFYDSEEFLAGTVAAFLAPTLREGDMAIVVATAAHRAAFEAALRASGVNVNAAVATGRYQALDAARGLDAFMVAGAPDPDCFADVVGGVIERAAAGGRRVRIYGEMVGMLCDTGDMASAIAVEDLWNEQAAMRGFTRLCGYAMRSFGGAGSSVGFKRICDQHSTVIPSESYATHGSADARQRMVAQLQQETTALRVEVADLRADRVDAELAYVEGMCAGGRELDPGTSWGNNRLRQAVRPAGPEGSPGARILTETLGTLSNRLLLARQR